MKLLSLFILVNIFSPKTVKQVKGEGMPYFDAKTQQNLKGDLFLKFNIIFPEHIDVRYHIELK